MNGVYVGYTFLINNVAAPIYYMHVGSSIQIQPLGTTTLPHTFAIFNSNNPAGGNMYLDSQGNPIGLIMQWANNEIKNFTATAPGNT